MSDRTLAELVAGRLRERGVFSLFVRALGPRQGVFISATGFDQAGALQRVYGEQASLEAALVSLLAELDNPKNVRLPPPERPQRPRPPSSAAGHGPGPGLMEIRGVREAQRRRRLAVAEVTRRGAVTVGLLADVCGLARASSTARTSCQRTLDALVDEGVFRVASAGDVPTYVAGDHFPSDERELTDIEEP